MHRKIVFFDIDGTLYMYGKKVPQDTRLAIRELRDRGHYAVLCTGRTKAMVYPEIYEIGFDGIIGGAGTYVEFKDSLLYEYRLEEPFSDTILKDMQESRILPILEGIDAIYFDEKEEFPSYRRIFELYRGKIPQYVKDTAKPGRRAVSKCSGMMTDMQAGEAFVEKYRPYFQVIYHLPHYIEMIPLGYSKAVGIERLIRHLQIPREDTYAFGDGMNDYEMLQYVQYGVAMGNAAEEFKAKVRYVTEAYDEGGISKALKRFGLIREAYWQNKHHYGSDED